MYSISSILVEAVLAHNLSFVFILVMMESIIVEQDMSNFILLYVESNNLFPNAGYLLLYTIYRKYS